MKRLAATISAGYRNGCIRLVCAGQRNMSAMLFLVGVALLSAGLHGLGHADIVEKPEEAKAEDPDSASGKNPDGASGTAPQGALPLPVELAFAAPPQNLDIPFDDTLIRNATGNLFRYIEGAFGALVMTAAGIGAIVAATMGAYKMAVALIVIAVGAFILRAFVSLFFGTNYPAYDVNGIEVVGNL